MRPPPANPVSEVERRRRLRATPAFVGAALVGASAVVAAFYPGVLDLDGLSQLAEARRHEYTDFHPPLMAWLWHWLDLVVPGPALMMVLQNVLFWSGLSLLGALAFPSLAGAAAVLAVGLVPSVFAQLGTVWKDVQMVSALVLATALILLADRRRRAGALAPAALLLFYAAAVRHNGITAVGPLAAWWGIVACRRGGVRRPVLLGVMAGAALSVGSYLAARSVTGALCRPEKALPFQSLLVHDLAGIAKVTGRDELPGWVSQIPNGLPTQRLRELYDPLTANPIYYGPGHLGYTTEREEIDELRQRWREAIAEHPGVYLRHRAQYFGRLVGVRGDTWYPYVDPVDIGVGTPNSPRHAAVLRALEHVKNGPFFRPWIFLAATGVLLAVGAARRRAGVATWAVAASSLTYLAPYFVLGPAPDFRYAWWTVVAALLLPSTLRPRSATPSSRGAAASPDPPARARPAATSAQRRA